jgi:hypothetical protein
LRMPLPPIEDATSMLRPKVRTTYEQ